MMLTSWQMTLKAERPHTEVPAAEITWKTDSLPIEQIARMTGWSVDYLRTEVLADPKFVGYARCRVRGAWDANLREQHAVWSSLLRLHAEGKV